MSDAAVSSMSQVYSMQAQCFTLHSTAVITAASIEKFGTQQSPVFNSPGGGNARIFGPDGRQMREDLPHTEEGMVFAELDMDLIVKEKAILDTVGHNNRPELVWLGRNTADQMVVRTN
jgi:predicted amidohydrolase